MSNNEEEFDLVQQLFAGSDYEHDTEVMERAGIEIMALRVKVFLFEERLAEVIEALKPFAAAGVSAVNPRYDPAFIATPFTFEDCAHAKTIVEKYK